MQSKLPEGLKEQIKIEANSIYWQTHKVSRERDPYCKGLTMFEVAQVPIINALIEKEERYLELKARCDKMEAAIEKVIGRIDHVNDTITNNVVSILKGATLHEGIEKEGEDEVTDSCPHCGKELHRDRNLCCKECGKEVERG